MIYDGCGVGSKLDPQKGAEQGKQENQNREYLTEGIQNGAVFTAEGFCNAQQAQNQFISSCAREISTNMPKDKLKKVIFFCLMWSFGASLSLDDRKNKLQNLLLNDASAKAAQFQPPPVKPNTSETIFSYFVND